MSIWCSTTEIGSPPNAWEGDDLPIAGHVLTYAEGFSNHYPDTTGTHERPAAVGLAHIAPWCVPGHNQDGEGYTCTGCGAMHDHPDHGPWLRLEVTGDGLSYWQKTDDGKPTPRLQDATVVMDREAALALAAALTEWAETTIEPVGEAS